MSLKSVLLFATAAVGHTLYTRQTRFGCGTPEPTEEYLEISRELAEEEATSRQAQRAFAVDVYFHSVASSERTLLSESTLQDQFDVMAADFAPYGINMNLAGTSRTVNPTWAADRNEMAMKRELRQGDYSALNMYFQEDLGGNLGYCYYPGNFGEGSEGFYRDGCAVLASSVPGGESVGFNLGKTAVHEAGHWFGLAHTFQGGCFGSGDGVADTPAQASFSSGCPIGRDSCPSQAGLDPIHNYMDYSQDSCYEEFTAGQSARMNSFWSRFRG